MPLQYTCMMCGKTFKVPPSRAKRGDPLTFCSRTCHFRYRAQSHVDISCAVCGAVMAAGRISMPATRKYCSQTCYNRARKARAAARAQQSRSQGRVASTAVCVICGMQFRAKPSAIAQGKRFCSLACRDAESRAKRQRTCEVCGTPYIADKGNKPSHYCSRACRLSVWTSPEGRKTTVARYETSWWKRIARKVRRRDGYRCQACGTTAGVLSVHHVIPVRCGGADVLANLITLCSPCHNAAEAQLRAAERAAGQSPPRAPISDETRRRRSDSLKAYWQAKRAAH